MIEGGALPTTQRYILCGMGGSALAGGLLTACDQTIPLAVHRDYGLPIIAGADSSSTLFIIASFSGNTEETLDAYDEARKTGRSLVAITAGGELLTRARRDSAPHIILPDATIQPRLAVGYFLKALALVTGAKGISDELESLALTLDLAKIETDAQSLAKKLIGRLPLFYSSNHYAPLAYFWKIMMNETAKVPAFSDTVPEQNHNELASFSAGGSAVPFTVVMLESDDDHPRVAKRFALLVELFASLNIPTEKIFLVGATPVARVINSIIFANATALALARGVDPSVVPVIEDFKSKLKII